VLRSTVLPGTTRGVAIPALEAASGKRAGEDFGVCFNPEFLREGTAVYDYRNPPKTVVSATDERSRKMLNEINSCLDAPLIECELEIAEMVKYADNIWHAVKIGFANEIGTVAKTLNLDGKKVMEIFCRDTKLNLSEKYLRPGFAFGGSCLPKDLRALNHRGRSLDLELPLLSSVLPSNERHMERAFHLVTALGKRPVGILGLSFKAGTDDLRESPVVELVEHLIGKGFDIRIFDGHVNLAKLVGANRDYILNHIPHISNLMVDSIDEAMEHGEIIVIGNGDAAFRSAIDKVGSDRIVVDLVGVCEKTSDGNVYHGICW
jgi:GDP-mannose 6-dehydrogenase